MRGDGRLDDHPGGLRKNYRCVVAKTPRTFARELRRQMTVELDAGPRDDDEMCEVEDLAPAMPRRQSEERVGAEDERQISVSILRAQLLERDDRIAAALARDLARVHFEARMA